jgi:hypothetical protein
MPAQINVPISESGAQIELEGAPFYFTEADDIEWEFKTEDYAIGIAGGETRSQRVGGLKKKPIKLSKPLQAGDEPIIAWCKDVNAEERTLDIVRFDAQGTRLYTDRLIGVRPTSLKMGKVDLNGSNLTMLEIELSWLEHERV